MGTGTVVLLVILAFIIFGIFFVVSIYNKLIQLKNRFKNAFAQIDVQLKRRYDLIPNLVKTAKGYMKHEREALEAVIKARNQASSAMEKASADPGNTEAIQGLMGAPPFCAG
jgi:LemA protein